MKDRTWKSVSSLDRKRANVLQGILPLDPSEERFNFVDARLEF